MFRALALLCLHDLLGMERPGLLALSLGRCAYKRFVKMY